MADKSSDDTDNFINRCKSFWINHWQGVVSILIPLLLLPILFQDLKNKQFHAMYAYCVMALYWITKVIPLPMTAFLPVMFWPFMGIMDSNQVCMAYLSDIVLFYLGTRIVSLAIEHCNLHQRIAVSCLRLLSSDPRRINYAIIFTTMLMSMLLSNLVATTLMCSIVRSILNSLESQGVVKANDELDKTANNEEPKASAVASCFYLSAAFASAIGGTSIITSTGINFTMKGMYEARFPTAPEDITFITFIAYALPLSILLALFLAAWMHIMFLRKSKPTTTSNEKTLLRTEQEELGPITVHEILVLVLFIIMIVLLFLMRAEFITASTDKYVEHSWPVVLISLLLFTLPMKYIFCRYVGAKGPFTQKEAPSLLSWKFADSNIQWANVWVIGGSIALVKGIVASGLHRWLIEVFNHLPNMPNWSLLLLCTIITVCLISFVFNSVAVILIIPIVTELAVALSVHPLYLVFPVGLMASYSFLTPLGSAQNNFVLSYANIRLKYMFLAGIGPTIAAILLVTINGCLWYPVLFPDKRNFLEWAPLNSFAPESNELENFDV